jgi:hypothetical protein
MATPRAKFVEKADLKKVAAWAYDAMQMASSHDPFLFGTHSRASEIIPWLLDLLEPIEILERHMQRLGAPEYRRPKKGKR